MLVFSYVCIERDRKRAKKRDCKKERERAKKGDSKKDKESERKCWADEQKEGACLAPTVLYLREYLHNFSDFFLFCQNITCHVLIRDIHKPDL